jgi:hypothetical protein
VVLADVTVAVVVMAATQEEAAAKVVRVEESLFAEKASPVVEVVAGVLVVNPKGHESDTRGVEGQAL